MKEEVQSKKLQSQFLKALQKTGDGRTYFSGFQGSYLPYLLAETGRSLSSPLLVICRDHTEALRLFEGLQFFSGADPHGADAGAHDPHGAGLEVALYLSEESIKLGKVMPSPKQVRAQMATLSRLAHQDAIVPKILLVNAASLLEKVPTRAFFERSSLSLKTGESHAHEALFQTLVEGGYHRLSQVEEPGTFAARGEILDLWGEGSERPYRVEFFDEEIERIRPFDPESQRSLDQELESILLPPARKVELSEATVESAKTALRRLFDEQLFPSSRYRAIAKDLEHGILPMGLELLLPAFHDKLVSLLDFLPKDMLCLLLEENESFQNLGRAAFRLQSQHENLMAEGDIPSYPLGELFMNESELVRQIQDRKPVKIASFLLEEDKKAGFYEVDGKGMHWLQQAVQERAQRNEEQLFLPLLEAMEEWEDKGMTVILTAASLGGQERLLSLLEPYGLPLQIHEGDFPSLLRKRQKGLFQCFVMVGSPGQGFSSEKEGLVLVHENEVLGRKPESPKRKRKRSIQGAIESYQDLKEGDLVVHLSHGVGRYRGLRTLRSMGLTSDVLEIEYAGKDSLLVPISSLNLVTKHQGGEGAPRLDRLGQSGLAKWMKTKGKVKKAVRDIADKLLKLYAEREATKGHAFSPPDDLYHRFELAFPYEETEDQQSAIDEVLADMQRARPMDRLICGDVGFGKTEIALRATMKAVLDGKQVAVLVPTQLLAEQHKRSFQERFQGFPVRVEALSSLKGRAQQKGVLEGLEAGYVDVVIGTHRLLSKDVLFKDLGLLVLDEEHRFGVAQKEHIKGKKANVDVLTLTATPIPRTLHMSLLGMRDLSLIQTPPGERLAVDTLIARNDPDLIREAIERELYRGGQVFFVHHRVSDIHQQAELISRLVPEARVVVGHGQMEKGELEGVMKRFLLKEANVLVATTIIESGIDIPSANTMFINHAEHFGLAQLHQLRGRVGRSAEKAYCYLLLHSVEHMKEKAAMRMQTIQAFSDLGSGYQIASQDLDIRGAGDILGADQAGNIDAVGYDAYMSLLRDAIQKKQGESEDAEDEGLGAFEGGSSWDCELRLPVDARIPESWIPDTHTRLKLYRELTSLENDMDMADLLARTRDRFGEVPKEVHQLIELMGIKLMAKRLSLKSISLGGQELVLGLSGRPPLRVESLLPYLGKNESLPEGLQLNRLSPEGLLYFSIPKGEPLREVKEVLRKLIRFSEAI